MRENIYEKMIEPYLDVISGWCREGLIEEEIYKRVGCSRTTFEKYKRKHPELRESLRVGKSYADTVVENALFKRATGFYYKDKYYPPDITAQIFWLKNRKKDVWRDKYADETPIDVLDTTVQALLGAATTIANSKGETKTESKKGE